MWDKDDDYDEWLVLGNIEIITILTLWWYYLVVLSIFFTKDYVIK